MKKTFKVHTAQRAPSLDFTTLRFPTKKRIDTTTMRCRKRSCDCAPKCSHQNCSLVNCFRFPFLDLFLRGARNEQRLHYRSDEFALGRLERQTMDVKTSSLRNGHLPIALTGAGTKHVPLYPVIPHILPCP